MCQTCGNNREECSDPGVDWFAYRTVCYATMTRNAFDAMYSELHDKKPFHDGKFSSWAADRSDSHPFRFDEGVEVNVSSQDVTPWDELTTDETASPIRSVAEESPGEQAETADERADEGEGGGG